MAKTQSLPPDVLDLIFQNLIESPATLKICAVVCKLWLRPSRHQLQSIKDLRIAPTEPGRVSEERVQILREMLLESKPECSFWPHITKLVIPGYAKQSSENCIQLVFKALSLASSLRNLQLYGIEFPTLLENAFPKNNSITSLLLKDSKFASPAQLLDLLASLQNLHSDLSLERIMFSNKGWEFEASDFVFHPSLRVRLEPKESLEDILPVVLECKMNVTFLKMDNAKAVGIDLYNQLLQHIGPSLEEIHIEFEDPREAFLEPEEEDNEDGDDEDEEDEGDGEDESEEEDEDDEGSKEDKEDEKESGKEDKCSAPISEFRNPLHHKVRAQKTHPGLASLDEEEIKARNKKDRAAAKRKDTKEQKKRQEDLLAVGTGKIAAHEDEVLTQIGQAPKVNARPPPGPITKKASRPVAQIAPREIVSKTIAGKSAAEDIAEDIEVVESDASKADDSDFAPPPDSECPSDSDAESEDDPDDVFMVIDNAEEKEESRKIQATHANRKKQRGQIRALIEGHRKVDQTPTAPNTGKRKTSNDDSPASPSRRSPLRKRTKSSATAIQGSTGQDDRFNLEYGGIMDDEIVEAIPFALKPSQVEVTTRLTPNAPLVKIEALDPGLPRRARNGATTQRKDRGYHSLNLTAPQLQKFKKLVVPALRSVLAVQPYPWDNTNPVLLEELSFIWRLVLNDAPRNIQLNGDEFAVSTQRNIEYRARIARDVRTACGVYLTDTCGESPSAIQEHVEHLLEDKKARYMWRTSDSDDPKEWEGLFLAPYIVAGISSHLEMTSGLPQELQVVEYPRGALVLATVAAERGLKAWSTGTDTFGENLDNKKSEEFSEANWGEATKLVRISVEKLSEKKWKKIMSAATEATVAVQTTPKLVRGNAVDVEDARAVAFEPDSD